MVKRNRGLAGYGPVGLILPVDRNVGLCIPFWATAIVRQAEDPYSRSAARVLDHIYRDFLTVLIGICQRQAFLPCCCSRYCDVLVSVHGLTLVGWAATTVDSPSRVRLGINILRYIYIKQTVCTIARLRARQRSSVFVLKEFYRTCS